MAKVTATDCATTKCTQLLQRLYHWIMVQRPCDWRSYTQIITQIMNPNADRKTELEDQKTVYLQEWLACVSEVLVSSPGTHRGGTECQQRRFRGSVEIRIYKLLASNEIQKEWTEGWVVQGCGVTDQDSGVAGRHTDGYREEWRSTPQGEKKWKYKGRLEILSNSQRAKYPKSATETI